MAKDKKRGLKFYSELIIVTVLSLLAASLWIEFTKGMVISHFGNMPAAWFGTAFVVSLVAIWFLNLLFSDPAMGKESEDQKEERYKPELSM